MKRTIKLLLLALLFAGCSGDDDTPLLKEIDLNDSEKEIAASSPEFAIKLLKAVDGTIADNNKFVVSPLSASQALSMALNGAQGNTYDQIAEALSLTDFSLDEINSCNSKVLNSIGRLEGNSQIEMANSLWLNEGFNTLDTYNERIAQYYSAEIESIDTSNENGVTRINKWINAQTNGLIPRYFDYISSDTKVIIVNALYFKCPWHQKFDKSETKIGKFYAADGIVQDVEFMETEKAGAPCMWYNGENYTLYSLYMGKEKSFCMDFILPNNGVELDECIATLCNGELMRAYNNIHISNKSRCRIPKIKMEIKEELNDAFKSMGITDAFNSNADFGMLSSANLSISKIQQANIFSIDEDGGKAATATDIEMGLGSTLNPDSYKTINRPFIFFIREVGTNTVIYAGKIDKF